MLTNRTPVDPNLTTRYFDPDETLAVVDSMLAGVRDEQLPDVIDALSDRLDLLGRTSPACRRRNAENLAHAIALSPAMYRHWIGNNDQIIDRWGESGYRMQDFISEADLATYRAYVYGPDAT